MLTIPPSTTLPHAAEPCPSCRPVRLPDGRPSGCSRCGNMFLRRMRREHFLKKPPAIAFNADFWEAQRPGLQWVLATDLDSARSWLIHADHFDRRRFHVARGYGPQWACLLRDWRELGEDNGHREKPQQLALALETAP
jgi:hypothetical protein